VRFKESGRNVLATAPAVRNDPLLRGGLSMGNPKITIIAYRLAIGFILAVAFHSSSKTLITRKCAGADARCRSEIR
jgi:hypothetical protein